jgi:predicted transcriptional regulator
MKAESLQLKSLYSEARELEKKVTVLMIELEQHHQQCITEISKAVGKKIKAIQKYEKEKIE